MVPEWSSSGIGSGTGGGDIITGAGRGGTFPGAGFPATMSAETIAGHGINPWVARR